MSTTATAPALLDGARSLLARAAATYQQQPDLRARSPRRTA
jgi:hypothetical protein